MQSFFFCRCAYLRDLCSLQSFPHLADFRKGLYCIYFFNLIQVSQVQKFLGSSLIGIRLYSALHIAKK